MSERQKSVSPVRLGKMLLLIGITLYLLFCLAMAVSQRAFIYYPLVVPAAQVSGMAREAGLERWTNAAGGPIGFKRLSRDQPAQGSVLITYGNGSTAIGSAHYAVEIQRAASLDVFIL